jgi:DNA-binding IclR family transcriptional regulator
MIAERRPRLPAKARTLPASAASRSTSSEKMLSVMDLFTPAAAEWTIDAMVGELGLSPSTIYRYVRSLVAVGLLFSARPGAYLLGPGIAHYDRQFRLADPLVLASEPVLRRMAGEFSPPGVLFIARIYRHHLLSMVEQPLGLVHFATSYGRGQLMPMDAGAPALAISAHTPIRVLRREFLGAGSGSARAEDWRAYKRRLRTVRAQGHAIDHGGIDAHASYLSVPVFRSDGAAVASLTLGVPAQPDATLLAQFAGRLAESAGLIQRTIESSSPTGTAL